VWREEEALVRVREGRGVEAGEVIEAGVEVEVEVREVHQVGLSPPSPPPCPLSLPPRPTATN
jgi:hypothetical protein